MNYDILAQETNQFFICVMDKLIKWVKSNESIIRRWSEETDYNLYDGVEALKYGFMRSEISEMEKKGWSVDDAVEWFLYTEEIDPRIPEDVALSKMHEISKRRSL